MDCHHCKKSFSEISEFEAHCLWHTERQAQLRRRPRKYGASGRSRVASTDKSTSSRRDGSAQLSPGSQITGQTFSSSSKSQSVGKTPISFSEHNIPDFDFDFGSLPPGMPASSQSLPIIKTLEDMVARFPAFEIEKAGDQSLPRRDYKCADCEALFSTQGDCDVHNQSRFCPGSAAIAFALYRDVRQLGGYRIDKKYLPFNGQQTSIKCAKCDLSFSNRLLKRVHERSHPAAHIECFHCGTTFSTAIELESHYQWHDDMEYRHHRNKCRRKLPGLKLQTKTLPKRQPRTGVADFGRKSVFLAAEDSTAVPERSNGENGEQVDNLEPEKELVAISFISPEDLERIYAPNGFFREVERDYLRPEKEPRTQSIAEALDALEGGPLISQGSSPRSTSSTEKGKPVGKFLKASHRADVTSPQPNGLKKRSSIRNLFQRTKSEPQLDSNLRKRSSFRKTLKDGTLDEGLVFDGRLKLSTLLQRVSTAANKGDLKGVRKECDRLMAMRPSFGPDADFSPVPIQAFGFPEGTLIQDTAGNLRYVGSETIDEITSGLRHTPLASWAKSKVSVLSTRAYLSTQDEEYRDAVWCYRQVLDLLQEHPMLFPDVIWHAAILSNLAHLSVRLHRPNDEEKYYLEALAISYNRYGRKDLNNINFLTALAAAYEKNDQTARAAEVYKRSLYARMEISGPGGNDTLMAMQELAAVHYKLGSLTRAKLLYERCLGGFETQLGLDHKVTLLIVDRLCNSYIQLQAEDEALAMYIRAFPHLQTACGPDDDLPRNWLSQYIEHTQNFDFPQEVSVYLHSYRTYPTEKNLSVLQSLARAYMLAGLPLDACETFEYVYNARRKLHGEQDPEFLEALHGHCLALDCMDDIDAAHSAYTNLAQLALRSPDTKDGKKGAVNVRIRLGALQQRKKLLAGEKDAWGQKSKGPCGTCKYQTSTFCPKCHISRFCCEACHDLAARSHELSCHPSVTLCQSRSVTTASSVPQRIEKQVIERLSFQDLRKGTKATLYHVSNSFTFNHDPRNFTTLRVKINSLVDTFISFDRSADIRFTVLGSFFPFPSAFSFLSSSSSSSSASPRPTEERDPKSDQSTVQLAAPHGGDDDDGDGSPSSQTSRETEAPPPSLKWSTPRETETFLLPKGTDVYLLIAPGETLFRATVEKRRNVRMSDSEHLEKLILPDETMVAYCQGLVLQGLQTTRRLCYLVEVES